MIEVHLVRLEYVTTVRARYPATLAQKLNRRGLPRTNARYLVLSIASIVGDVRSMLTWSKVHAVYFRTAVRFV